MLPLTLGREGVPLHVLCLGAHSDDIEIGCAGTLLRWLGEHEQVVVTWVVFSATGARASEARGSARALLRRAAGVEIVLGDFVDARLPSEFERAKEFVADIARRVSPDVVFTHRLDDRHQDHRLVAELTWQAWRDHLVLEYEIPKYEGDLGQPNVYVPLTKAVVARKLRHLLSHFGSQRGKDWFRESTFRGLMAVRGVECRAPDAAAEAFHMRKAVL
jgi:LmbE family N-acetylglucosaminyl deacetylase